MLPRTHFESLKQPVVSRRKFAWRLFLAGAFWLAMTLLGLGIGMLGYAWTEGMGMVDAFLNAAMILSGMGPAVELKTDAGKLFAGFYAILSGLLIVIASGFVLAPIMHRVLHAFHVERGPERDE